MQMYSKRDKNDAIQKEIYDIKTRQTGHQPPEIQQDYLILAIKILRFLIYFSH